MIKSINLIIHFEGYKMKLKLTFMILVSAITIFVISGCARPGVQEVDAGATRHVLYSQSGIIESIRPVAVKDNGIGTFIGAIAGTILGSLIGHGRGNTLATLAGGLSGAYVGNQVGKANAQELTVALDDGRNVVVIAKGTRFYTGERIRIIKRGNRVVNIEAL